LNNKIESCPACVLTLNADSGLCLCQIIRGQVGKKAYVMSWSNKTEREINNGRRFIILIPNFTVERYKEQNNDL
jgi:hypothetical protein